MNVKEFIMANFDSKWAGDARHPLKVGDVGFLLALTPAAFWGARFHPRQRLEIRPHPVRVAGTLEEVLYGVIPGERTEVEALGVARVLEVSANGRGRVQSLWGDDAVIALDQLAYPDLADDLYIGSEPYETNDT